MRGIGWWVMLALMFWCFLISFIKGCYGIDVDRMCNAIYKAEGGAKASHLYGIMQHFKTTTPRQACINTVNHAVRDYKGREDGFIPFLASRYAPLNVKGDPSNLNQYWKRNVEYFYNREEY